MKNFYELTAAEAVTLYEELDLIKEAEEIKASNNGEDLETKAWPWNREPKAWEHSSYAYGFISNVKDEEEDLEIYDARNISSNHDLQNSKLTISLDFLRVYDYPGRGIHQVLFQFQAKNQFGDNSEDILFNQVFNIQEGQRAPISGYPIFIGLNTGKELVQFNVKITNVSNNNDEEVMKAINNGVFTNGLKLLGSINPVVPVVTEYAKSITEMIASRNRNRNIIAPKMGLYFSNSPGRMKLAEGMYIAVQLSDPDKFDWNNWTYNRSRGTIISKNVDQTELPYNYFIFSISKTN